MFLLKDAANSKSYTYCNTLSLHDSRPSYSTAGGRDSGWPSGPVMPCFSSSCCRWNTSSPFSACTVQMAPSSRARRKLFTSRSEEHTSELQSLMRISYAVFCLKKKKHEDCKHENKTVTIYKHIT